jgi:hypothetical protein
LRCRQEYIVGKKGPPGEDVGDQGHDEATQCSV